MLARMVFRYYLKRLVVLLLIGVGLWFALKPAWRGFRHWRADRLLEQSREFAEARNWGEAKRTAVAAFQLSKSIEAFRLAFEAFYQTDASSTSSGRVGVIGAGI